MIRGLSYPVHDYPDKEEIISDKMFMLPAMEQVGLLRKRVNVK
jgi:hypothetical protein